MDDKTTDPRMTGLAEQFMSSWQSNIFRERCRVQIESVRSQVKPRENSSDAVENFLAKNNSIQLEEFVFNKSKTREEYMSLISEMIMMLREHAGKAVVDMSVLQNADPGMLAAAGVNPTILESLSSPNGKRENGETSKDDK